MLALALVGLAALAGGCAPTMTSASRPLTIVLVEYEGPRARAAAEESAKDLSSQGLPDVFVVEGDTRASVCVGHYQTLSDPQAKETLARVRQTRDSSGQFPFAGVMLMPIPEKIPENPWPLEKAKGFFTLHVASWEAPGRIEAAQKYAEHLRSRGYEAYVYHGPRMSMVTIGAFGPEIFEVPGQFSKPGARPRIIGPKVLDLIRQFPRMRLAGEETPPEAEVPTQLVEIPGRQPPTGAVIIPRALYRVSMSLVSTRTGIAQGLGVASGVAQSQQELPALVATLARQILASLPPGKAVRVGVVGVLATDPDAAKDKADAEVCNALATALGALGAGKIDLSGVDATRQILDAANLKVIDVLRDPRLAKGLAALDYVAVATVTEFPVQKSESAPPAPQP